MSDNSKRLPETASQTAGPYVHIGLAPQMAGFDIYDHELGTDIAGPNALGDRIRVEGVVRDGNGDPVTDVMLETWQPNSDGKFLHDEGVEEGFVGWGRVACDLETGEWGFDTIIPGSVGKEAPHINFWIVARGINAGLNTRMYFADFDGRNATDPVLNLIAEPNRRATLIADSSMRDGRKVYRFEINLQGDNETVFFDV